MRNPFSTIPVILGVVALSAFLTGPALGQAAMEESLYDRLGGYEAISAVVTVFAGKLFECRLDLPPVPELPPADPHWSGHGAR